MSVQIRNITAGYGPKAVLQDLSSEFKGGEFCALVGPNGSGKSTLIKVMAGLITPTTGKISGIPKLKPIAQTLSYLAQDRIAHPQMQVEEIVALGRAPYRKPFKGKNQHDRAAIATALEQADITHLKKRAFGTLSGGQQARVLLARALAVEAPIMLVDEPVAALDPYYQLSILACLKKQTEKGRTVIAALHDLSLVRQFADTVCVLNESKVMAFGKIDETLTPKILRDVFRIRETNGLREAL